MTQAALAMWRRILFLAFVGTILANVVPGVASARERISYTVPRRITADCSRDVTAKLQAWIASVRNHAVVSFPKRACYRLDGTLTIVNRRDLTLDGNGAMLRAGTDGTQGRRHVVFQGGGPYVVRNLTVVGADHEASAAGATYVASRAFQHGFALQGVAGATLDRVRVRGVYGDFVYVGTGANGTWSRDIAISRSTFEGAGRQGIAIVAGQNITISRNTIAGVGRSMFDLEPNTASGGARNVTINGNVTGAARNFWLASKGHGGATVANIRISGNRATAPTGNLVWVRGGLPRGPFTVDQNRFQLLGTVGDDGSQGAFFFAGCANVSITGNEAVFPAGKQQPAVEIRNSRDVVVEGNAFPNAGQLVLDTTPR